jgi:hypothetical protein
VLQPARGLQDLADLIRENRYRFDKLSFWLHFRPRRFARARAASH